MQSLGELSLIDMAVARAQSRVADFLKQKEILIKLTNNPSITVSQRATELLSMQHNLEGQLGSIFQLIEKVKGGQWSFSDLFNIGNFADSMEKQIENSRALQKQVGTTGIYEGIPSSWATYAMILGGLIFGYTIIKRI